MGDKKVLHFELLGTFSCEGITCRAGRKVLAFLQYLVVHHERNISAAELIEEFWPEHSDAPADALRRILFRVRAFLKERYPEQEDILLTFPGCYAWNPEIRLELDTKQFETAFLEAGRKKGEERTKALLHAVSLYRGDFLSANDSGWVMGPRQYYRALYLDACKALLPLLEKKEQWVEILAVCEQACRIDFTVEDFIVYQMQALIVLGQPEQAVEKYEFFRDRMLEEFQTEPSKHVEQVCMLARGLRKKEMAVPDIFRLLKEEESVDKAFFCTFEMFRSIVALERRHLSRTGGSAALVIVRLGQGAVPAADSRRLERILLEGLRTGDPVARLEAGSYIFMLSDADEEKARLVTSRIDRNFRKTYRTSKARITYYIENVPL